MHRWIGSLLAVLIIPLFVPITTQAQTERCFTETGFCISGRMREYWEQNGGLAVFGLPITAQQSETIEGKTLQVQWFERNRLELHAENQAPYDVLLGRIGAERLAQQGRAGTFPAGQQQADCRFFAETGQNVCGAMLAAWRKYGLELDNRAAKSEAESLALFGLPLSGEMTETLEGKEYKVQYFERARFELHPEIGPDTVLFGLLGSEVRAAAIAPKPEPTQPPTETPPPLPPASYNGCQEDPTAASAPNTPVKIVAINKETEVVTLQNVSGTAVDLTGWHMCSLRGAQEHPISGTLAPGETKEFPNTTGDNMWSNENPDDGVLYNASGQAVSYWRDPAGQ